ncbi:MAG: hypothetical protein AMK73_05960 [Planctomycetes bacterium SM23_32]|nr:MAG: hypothetical protein AMK73_05960 [Planctomycetes bacterium SM23_32]
MARLTPQQDAFGRAMYDHYRGIPAYEICERDDGHVALSGGPAIYLADYGVWPPHQKQAIRLARGKVLDIGCGAGRHSLYLQGKGLDVTGIDTSPLAVKVCRLRGLKKARLLPVTRVSRRLGTFDTVLMFGNNFGLMGGFRRGRWLLRRFGGMTSEGARILAESRDPYATDDPIHRAYHRRNRRRGRMGGQIRLRVRYRTCATPWLDYLLASQDEMRAILDGTGWHLARAIDGTDGSYVAVIEKAP